MLTASTERQSKWLVPILDLFIWSDGETTQGSQAYSIPANPCKE